MVSALTRPPTPPALSPLLGRHVWSERWDLGILTFRSNDKTPIYGLTWLHQKTTYGCAVVLLELGIRFLPGRSELPVYPSRVNDDGTLEGLGSCEFQARREIEQQGLGRAA